MNFEKMFEALTDLRPFPWQCALYERLVAGCPPVCACRIPTGLGKTAIIPTWLIALTAKPGDVPRRLVYVVNRRTVVDQATDEAINLRKRLATERAQPLVERLTSLCAEPDGVPLAISTLRGQFADNREWSADPSRPAVILGTVDMIGSRLLFNGYGIGFKSRPLHAGFLGQDVLLVHDEAHLEPAFQRLLLSIVNEQRRSHEFRRFHVMELSATARGSGAVPKPMAESPGEDTFVLKLSDRDLDEPEIQRRYFARKSIHLHELDDVKKLPERLAELALVLDDSNRRVLVFARSVKDVEKIAERLRKVNRRVETLTGTMRGKERDELVEKTVFRRFLPGAEPGGETVYLVCTSAGEVGVNISADDLLCDLSTFESMAQRFGRVNRFGMLTDTRIDVVHPKDFDTKDGLAIPLERTLNLLGKLKGDGSPAALDKLDPDERYEAFSPEPKFLPVSDILFDAWAMTTVTDKLPGRPPVEPYLHGESDQEPPETQVAWRDEVGQIKDTLLDLYKPEELLEDYPIKPHELLRDRSDRVFERLASLAKTHEKAPVWLLDRYGKLWTNLTLGELAEKEAKERIERGTVLLSPRVGGLKNGLLTGNPTDEADDVADDWLDEQRQKRRRRVWDDDRPPEKMRLIRRIDTRPDDGVTAEEESDAGESQRRFWYWFVRPRSADDDGSTTSWGAVRWKDHTDDVVRIARQIVGVLPLPADVRRAVILAASYHDLGKKRIVWQRSIGNLSPTNWLAKGGRHPRFGNMKPIELTPYRHEFGSLLDVYDKPGYATLDPTERDLVLHLIAVHHGYGRPHFPSERAFDPEPRARDAGAVAAEVPLRFARLQRRYGRWGLAYIESLLRAADYAASADPSAFVEVDS